MADFALDVNGRIMQVTAEPDTPLLWVLREHLQLTGPLLYRLTPTSTRRSPTSADAERTRECAKQSITRRA